ncbi:MAG: hypothetical protein NTU51_08070 [Bacteroidetes bacterium]|nr:hypothetical protein [Bacteroidota bacterium]
MNAIQNVSILMELAVTILGLLIWLQKKKSYGAFIFLTFLLYMVYDACKLWTLAVPELILRIIFVVASLSILVAVWKLYKAD